MLTIIIKFLKYLNKAYYINSFNSNNSVYLL